MFKVKKLKEFKKHFQPEPKRREVIYTAERAYFLSQEDSYEQGVIGGGASWDYELNLSAHTVCELFEKVKDKLWMKDKDYYWSVELESQCSCSGFRVCYLGDVDNDLACESQVESWKQGKERLWCVDGWVNIEKTIVPRFVPDREMLRFAKQNNLEIL